jgi:hypothetical protein
MFFTKWAIYSCNYLICITKWTICSCNYLVCITISAICSCNYLVCITISAICSCNYLVCITISAICSCNYLVCITISAICSCNYLVCITTHVRFYYHLVWSLTTFFTFISTLTVCRHIYLGDHGAYLMPTESNHLSQCRMMKAVFSYKDAMHESWYMRLCSIHG